jgi:hypothetical protein
MPYARVELWRRASTAYHGATGRSYFDDLFALHQALGLAIAPAGAHIGLSTRAFAHLTPLRNREIVILAEHTGSSRGEREPRSGGVDELNRPGSPSPLLPFAPVTVSSLTTIIAHVLRCLIDHLGTRAFNLAIALPPLGPAAEDWRDLPIVARLGDRGNPLANRSDIGAMEIYASGCITADPFEVAAALRAMSDEQ